MCAQRLNIGPDCGTGGPQKLPGRKHTHELAGVKHGDTSGVSKKSPLLASLVFDANLQTIQASRVVPCPQQQA